MFPILFLLFTFTCLFSFSSANVEKVVFIAEPSIGFKDLPLPSLHPQQPQIFQKLSLSTRDNSSWYLLQDLRIGQRFEVRVCWPATVSKRDRSTSSIVPDVRQHPTKFDVNIFSISDVLDNSILVESVSQYSNSRVFDSCIAPGPDSDSERSSTYFLRIQASPEYVSPPSEVPVEPIPVPIDISKLALPPDFTVWRTHRCST